VVFATAVFLIFLVICRYHVKLTLGRKNVNSNARLGRRSRASSQCIVAHPRPLCCGNRDLAAITALAFGFDDLKVRLDGPPTAGNCGPCRTN
jgi:hypothetical protein